MEKLKAIIDTQYETRADFAKALGISPSRLSRMLSTGSWRADQIRKAVEHLKIPAQEIPAYFFAPSVAIKTTGRSES